MLPEEARWFASRFARMEAEQLFPLLNFGSSTERFRTVEQPWIDRELFAPLRAAGREVIHMDLKAGEGVDVVGDIGEPAVRARVLERAPRAILCSNLLEHVPQQERVELCAALEALLPPGGTLFLSCPYRFPFHPDPIDTMFRPDVAELAALFPSLTLVEGEILQSHTFWDQIRRGPRFLAKLALRMLLPFYKPQSWYSILCHLPWLRRRFEATCVMMRKAP